MQNKSCNTCGRNSSLQAIFCCGCGSKFLATKSTENHTAVFGTSELLMAAGSIIALIGGIIGVLVSEHYGSVSGFSPAMTAFFITSLFGFASFAYSISGLVGLVKKRISKR